VTTSVYCILYTIWCVGGSWATAVYAYDQKDTVSDSVMLGSIVFPEDIKYSALSSMNEDCVRSFTNSSGVDLSGVTFAAWLDAVQVSQFTFMFCVVCVCALCVVCVCALCVFVCVFCVYVLCVYVLCVCVCVLRVCSVCMFCVCVWHLHVIW
jgi:hypothetical protein